MHKPVFRCVALCMAVLLVCATLPDLRLTSPAPAYAQDQTITINEALNKSYIDLFEYAEKPQYTAAEIESFS